MKSSSHESVRFSDFDRWLNPLRVEQAIFCSQLEPDEITEIIKGHFRRIGGWVPARSKPSLDGWATSTRFELRSRLRWLKAIRPSLCGTISASENGTQLDVELRLSRFEFFVTWPVMIFTIHIISVWVGMSPSWEMLLLCATPLPFILAFVGLRWRNRNDWNGWKEFLPERLGATPVSDSGDS